MAKEKQTGEAKKLTPMMQQYMAVKEQNPDAILFYRLGDFYEMFFEDAKVASRELELTLTGRDCGLPQRAPMCGVPFHSAESYIARLIQKGYKVAICEQMEDPATAKGLVKRDVIRKITSGTLLESTMLDEKRNNFICAIQWDDTYGAGLCFCDISTGQTQAIEMFGGGLAGAVISELARFEPSEAVLSPKAMEQEEVLAFLTKRLSCQIERGEEQDFTEEAGRQWIGKHFENTPQLQEDTEGRPMLIGAVGGLLSYLHQTQKNDLRQINRLEVYTKAQFMGLDPAARRNLELCQVMRSGEKKGSLLWVLDYTRTAMGGRLLRQWLEKPLVNAAQIALRQNAVQALLQDRPRRDGVLEGLRGVFDLERLISRVVYGSANCRDLRSLWQTACHIPQVKENLEGFGGSQYLKELWEEIDCLEDVADLDAALQVEGTRAVGGQVALAHLGGFNRAVGGEVAAHDQVQHVTLLGVGTRHPGGTLDDARVHQVAHGTGGVALLVHDTLRRVRSENRGADVAAHQLGVRLKVGVRRHVDLGGGHGGFQTLHVDIAVAGDAHDEELALAVRVGQRYDDVLQRVGGGPRAILARVLLVEQVNERLDRRSIGGGDLNRRGNAGRINGLGNGGRHGLRVGGVAARGSHEGILADR